MVYIFDVLYESLLIDRNEENAEQDLNKLG